MCLRGQLRMCSPVRSKLALVHHRLEKNSLAYEVMRRKDRNEMEIMVTYAQGRRFRDVEAQTKLEK